ncbi:hypothetical protein EMIHUDRAFT_235187 [Emiliania huxleyi CCMP1516]|uniref:Transferrin receptor-like dimerisation domain-containing protein n=2 Tax=Emiliania huxleyi TaxID=2903 RepID=A0A0D3JX68_EMIH1|nr:hypothetical protein EMIHUDRAFT_235187 [Emiliania huxleyi CCMP1516]EOD28103.1 hypothetical protein EMIHUDRAFT_235187 [Emiliania huxleyi CCMP1516]|eukprot:XP_005780532.1 hypothetical protein EMIHUDRAFT_235187 [Emiliania huxleyi CCMP1516]
MVVGVYHSTFDSFEWMDSEGDPGFVRHAHARNVSSSNASRVNFGPLEAAHARFAAAAGKNQPRSAFAGAAAALNEKLAYAERRFLSASGLPTRKYFRHVLQTLPGVYDAVSAGDWATADAQARAVERTLTADVQARVAAERIDAAASFLLAE